MRVAITGAAGFIGSNVVRELVARGHSVDALVRPGSTTRRLDDIAKPVSVWPVDLSQGAEVETFIDRTEPDALVHLAWIATPGSYLYDIAGNLAALENSVRLLRLLASGPTSRLVIAGTCLEGEQPRAQGLPDPIYAVAKRALHQLASTVDADRLGVCCAHIFSVFGPQEDERRAVPSVINSLIRGEPVDVGAGAERRDYVHVFDVASALATILESDLAGEVDVCSGAPHTLRAVFEEIGRATGARQLIRWGARPPEGSQGFGDAVGDPRALEAIGWRPRLTFAEGIEETVAWWRAQASNPVGLEAAG